MSEPAVPQGPVPAAGADDYAAALAALLPHGAAWPRDRDSVAMAVVRGLAAEMARVHEHMRAEVLERETAPWRAVDPLAEWEAILGLPDCCSPADATTEERRAALAERLTSRGGQSRAYFTAVAAALGYAITITEYRPFRCGLSCCGQALNADPGWYAVWRVTVPDPRLAPFRCATSRCGQRLLAIRRAEDLECRLRRLAPAHTRLVFDYTGV